MDDREAVLAKHHENVRRNRMLRPKFWKYTSIVLLIILVIGLYATSQGILGSTSATSYQGTVDPAAVDKALDYINTNMLAGLATAELLEVTEEGDLYRLDLNIITLDGLTEEYTSYVTKDGKRLFPASVEIDGVQIVEEVEMVEVVEEEAMETDEESMEEMEHMEAEESEEMQEMDPVNMTHEEQDAMIKEIIGEVDYEAMHEDIDAFVEEYGLLPIEFEAEFTQWYFEELLQDDFEQYQEALNMYLFNNGFCDTQDCMEIEESDTEMEMNESMQETETEETENSEEIVIDTSSDPMMGPSDAPVTVTVYSDFECEFCEKLYWTLQLVEEAYADDVKMVFKNFPLEANPNAHKAAEAGECAHAQGMFWEYHDKLFENFNALEIDNLKGYAQDLGLDTAEFDNCLDSSSMESAVAQDVSDGQSQGVSTAPTFFINDEMLVGAEPFSSFEVLIDLELAS